MLREEMKNKYIASNARKSEPTGPSLWIRH